MAISKALIDNKLGVYVEESGKLWKRVKAGDEEMMRVRDTRVSSEEKAG